MPKDKFTLLDAMNLKNKEIGIVEMMNLSIEFCTFTHLEFLVDLLNSNSIDDKWITYISNELPKLKTL